MSESIKIHIPQIADNFKTDIDQLNLSRKGMELTGEEKAEDFDGEVVVVRPNMDQWCSETMQFTCGQEETKILQ